LLEFEEYQLPQQCTAKSLLILLDATCGVLFSTASTLLTAAVLSTVGQVLGPLVVAVGAFVKLPITDQNNDPSDTDTMLFGILASLFPNRDTSSGDIENCLCLRFCSMLVVPSAHSEFIFRMISPYLDLVCLSSTSLNCLL
jgi:hypothetical protein